MKHLVHASSLAALGLLSLLTAARAQSTSEEEELAQAFGDKTTVSIATGATQLLRRAPAVASVVTAADMAAAGVTDLDQALATVPGLHVSRNLQAYNPLYVIRGIYSEYNNQTLVLYNGVPMTTMFIGNRGAMWAGLPVHNVSRVEVIRGPGSALYGADAYAGVINIITKTAAELNGLEAGLRLGSFDSRDAWMQYGRQSGGTSWSGYLRVASTEGQRRTISADAQTGLDALFGTSASRAPGPVNLGYKAIDAHVEANVDKLKLRAGYTLRDDVQPGAGAASALDPVGQGRSQRWNASVSLGDLALSEDLRLSLNGSFFQFVNQFPTVLQLLPPGAFGGAFPNGMFGAPNTWERQIRTQGMLEYRGIKGHSVRVAIGHDDLDMYRTQEFKNFAVIPSGPFKGLPSPLPDARVIEVPVADSFVTPHRRRVSYVYAQDEWNFARDWTLTAGVRQDHYSDFGSTTNPRVAVVWDASLDVTVKLLAGRAFRAPSFSEEYSINNPVIQGNPYLKPERIGTAELAVSWQASTDTQWQLSAFRYTTADMIRATAVGGGTSEYQNTGTQHGHGFEIEVTKDLSRDLRLAANLSLQRATEKATGQDAGYAPHRMGYVRADWRFDRAWSLAAQLKHVGSRTRPAGDVRPPIRDYTSADFTLRHAPSARGWEFALSLRNAFDADIREPSLAPGTSLPNDLPQAGRALDAQVLYRF